MPAAKRKNRRTGSIGEDFAIRLLGKNGYKVIAKNFRSKVGEIDIIAMDGDTLVFVEVKTRKSDKYGFPEEAVTKRKLAHIVKAAYAFIKKYQPSYKKLRVDVVALTVEGNLVTRSKLIKVDEI